MHLSIQKRFQVFYFQIWRGGLSCGIIDVVSVAKIPFLRGLGSIF
jgi:hypothetical protein